MPEVDGLEVKWQKNGVTVSTVENAESEILEIRICFDKRALVAEAIPSLLAKLLDAKAPTAEPKKARAAKKKDGAEHEPDKDQKGFPFGGNVVDLRTAAAGPVTK